MEANVNNNWINVYYNYILYLYVYIYVECISSKDNHLNNFCNYDNIKNIFLAIYNILKRNLSRNFINAKISFSKISIFF